MTLTKSSVHSIVPFVQFPSRGIICECDKNVNSNPNFCFSLRRFPNIGV